LATISIGGIHCVFVNGENHKFLNYLTLLIPGCSEKGGKIAEYGAEGAQAIGNEIRQVLATISIGGMCCSLVNCENDKYLNYLILLISGRSKMGKKIAKFAATGARAIGTDIWKVLATISIGGILCFFVNGENH
jgi:hypothetical protein